MASPTIDGSATGTSGAGQVTSGSATLTTTQTNDVIVVAIFIEDDVGGGVTRTVTSVTATGLTFSKRYSTSESSHHSDIELWYAKASGALSSVVITANFSGGVDDWSIVAFGVHGCDPTNPWDSNLSIPVSTELTTGGSVGTPSISGISTDNAEDLLFAIFASIQNGASARAAVPTGFSQVAGVGTSNNNQYAQLSVADKSVSATQSSITVSWNPGGSASGYGPVAWLLVDALTADAASPAGGSRPQLIVVAA